MLLTALPLSAAVTVTLSTNTIQVPKQEVTKTTVETVDFGTVNVTPSETTTTTTTTTSPQKSLFDGLSNLLALHDPDKHFFNGDTNAMNNSVELIQSAVVDSRKTGVYQATTIGFWHRLDTDLELGASLEADSLGAGGNTVDAIGGHAMIRYDWDNVALSGGIGGIRDIANKVGIVEALIGFEVRLSRNVGTFAGVGFGYCPETKGKDGIVDRLFVGATVALGK